MKGIKHLFAGLVFGLIIGWSAGYLRLPYLEKNWSFLLGFVTALAVVCLVLLLLSMGKRGEVADSTALPCTRAYLWGLLLGLVGLGGLSLGLTAYQEQATFKRQIRDQDKKIQDLSARIDVLKKSDFKPLLQLLLEDLGTELKLSPRRTLRDTSVVRIAALSQALMPTLNLEGDSLSAQAYSPGRGQLLQALLLLNIDTGTFAKIKRGADFSGADLPGANFKGSDLSGIKLQGANLKDANLEGANLTAAALGKTNLWGANLNQANLQQADLKRADLSWAKLSKALLSKANLNGAILANAQFNQADLNGALFQWAQSSGALFNEANLTGVTFTGSDCTKANFSQANLGASDLRKINLNEADLQGANLDKAMIEEKWQEKFQAWQISGWQVLGQQYKLVNDTFEIDKRPLYRLRKIQ